MGQAIRMTTTLEPRGPAAAIVLTDDQVRQLSEKKTAPVLVTIGDTTIRLRVARMGGENLIGLSKQARSDLGVDIGQAVDVVVTLDDQPREVDIPDDLAAAFAGEPGAKAAFDALAYSHRKEHARSVADAKRPETRAKRVAAVLDAVRPAK